MAKITGIGGVFFKAKGDHKALAAWYQRHLGLALEIVLLLTGERLPKQPGARETRWVHLLSGEPVVTTPSAPAPSAVGGEALTMSEVASIKANVAQLQGEVESLKATVARLCQELGITP